eukprot:INCI1241.3.p1 GENE.INCI1241.3~~INCI1241.3.p1  ORF type:complete len:269 (+),score=34.09 INCI1241.3:248-1054(+)
MQPQRAPPRGTGKPPQEDDTRGGSKGAAGGEGGGAGGRGAGGLTEDSSSQSPTRSNRSDGDEQVFQAWRREKVAQWHGEAAGKRKQVLHTKFKTLAELESWLDEKGAAAHVKTQQQRQAAPRGSCKAGSSKGRSNPLRGISEGPALVLCIVVAILVVTLLAGLATLSMRASLHGGTVAAAGVRRSEPAVPETDFGHRAGTGADALAAKLREDERKPGLRVSDAEAAQAIVEAKRQAEAVRASLAAPRQLSGFPTTVLILSASGFPAGT